MRSTDNFKKISEKKVNKKKKYVYKGHTKYK